VSAYASPGAAWQSPACLLARVSRQPDVCCTHLRRSLNYKEVLEEFWAPTGPHKLVFFHQVRRGPHSQACG